MLVGSTLAAALAFVQNQPKIDADRTAMIGHSEGGMLILQASVEGKGFRKPPAALVLVATPGWRADIVLREQIAFLAWQYASQRR